MVYPYTKYRFSVEIEDLGQAGFSEMSGLDTSIEAHEYREDNDKAPTASKYADFRILLKKDASNGLEEDSYLMVDKLVTVPKSKLNRRVGVIDDTVLNEILSRIALFLGITKEHVQ
jgi:hypothetical protein